MTDLEKVLIYGSMIDRLNRDLGYNGKSVIPWGKVGLCIGLDILNAGIRSAKYKPYGYSSYRKRKRF